MRRGYEYLSDKIHFDDMDSILWEKSYELIKNTGVRFVVSMPGLNGNGNRVYIKQFKRKTNLNLKYFLFPARAKIEWQVANTLLDKGIKTFQPVAVAEKRSLGSLRIDLIISREIINSTSFHDFCQTNFNGPLSEAKILEKKNLLNILALFIRDLHDKGVFHSDLTSGNILIQSGNRHSVSGQGYSFYLIDLHHAKILRKLSKRKRLFNLAQMFNALISVLTKSDKLAFIENYGKNILDSKKNIQALTDQIDTLSSKIRGVHFRSRLKRCVKNSSVYSKNKFGTFKVFYRKGYDTGSFLHLIVKHRKALANNDWGSIIKRDSKTCLTRFPFEDNEIHSVVVKQYKKPFFLCLLKNIFRKPPGRKAWIAGNGLFVYGIPTPKPIALLEKRIAGIVTDSYIIMEAVPDSLEMDRYLLKNFQNQSENCLSPGTGKKRKFIDTFAQTIGVMHEKMVFHHDLKTCNIMVKENTFVRFYFSRFR